MTGELRGKRALVTGASRGIGRAVADRLRAEGASVLSVARTTIETGDAETMVAADTCFRASSSPAWRASRASTPSDFFNCSWLMRAARCSKGSVSGWLTFVTVVGTWAPVLGAMPQRVLKTPPIPETGPLARPKPLRQVGAPVDATRAVIPADNPQTPEKIALGQRLFFDGRLSADGSVACSTCHDPARAFTDRRPASIGINGGVGQRNAPTILNALYNKTQFWDGRVKTLEEQAALPITNPVEMGQPSMEAAVAKIAAIQDYQGAFQHVFGHPPNSSDLVRAIASYERTQLSFDSPFDHFIAGDRNAIDDSAKHGWELFNTRARCNKCHALSEDKRDVTYFTDNDFHNIGIGIIRHNVVALARQAEQLVNSGDPTAIDRAAIQTDMSALGRFLITKKESDIASFKTPDLRNVLVTGPYFHDGSQETLWDVMDHYNKGDGLENPYLDEDIQPLALTEAEIDDVVAFLASLTSADYADQGREELARQREISRTNRPQRDTARAFGPKPPRPQPPAP